jgi:cell division protein FtsN
MTDARTASGFDRLPWLADEPAPPAKGRSLRLLLLITTGALAIAGASYWMGRTTGTQSLATPKASRPSTTLPLPEARPAEPQVPLERVPEVQPEAVPTITPEPQREVSIPRLPARPIAKVAPAKKAPKTTVPKPAPAARAQPAPLALWPSARSAGAAGRLIQVGAFGTRYQAKRGWWAMVRAYPALKGLPTVVADARNSRGKRFYRLQIGTTSQAHSEVLCQRMEKIRYSCAVVGLPWKPKGVER